MPEPTSTRPDGNQPEPPFSIREIHVTGWNADPWTMGPYSSLGVGGRPEHRSTLGTPIAGRIALAGEHTSVEYPATMHGAFNAGAAAAAALIEASHPATAIVVGAGLAGLSAARGFIAAGVEVTVFEATPAPGGRARTQTLPSGTTIHPGAAWIHGPNANPIATLAGQLGVTGRPDRPGRSGYVHAGGSELTADEVRSVEATTQMILNALRDAARQSRTAGLPDVPMRTVLDAALEQLGGASMRAAVRTQLDLHFESLMAARLDNLSFQYGDEPYAYPGGDVYLTSFLQPIVDHLSDGIVIRCNTPVEHVAYNSSGTTIHTAPESGVEHRHSADVCVLTVPVGPLKAGRIEFDPPLPEAHQAALAYLEMGDKCKVFVRFDRAWWGDHDEFFIAADPAADHNRLPTAWAAWVDVSEPVGSPTLCAFLGGAAGARVQATFGSHGGAALAHEITEALSHWANR